MAYIKREIEAEATDLASKYKILTITGPRQSGKTTLVRNLFGHLPYYSMESPDIRFSVQNDPRGFFQSNKSGAIIDEAQHVPEIFSYLQEIVDLSTEKCLFILTGSNHFLLMNNISQSLAGRTGILRLLPLSVNELKNHGINLTADEYLYSGFYPGVYSNQLNPTKAYRMYHETYIEKDIRLLANLKDLSLFEKFIHLCAGRIGSLLNVSNLANETGVSSPTIQSWISLLEASFVIFLLPPYFENLNKRLVRMHKLYFYDPGIACYLLGIENLTQIARDPLRGALFENLVIAEALKSRYNRGLVPNIYFYRDSHHNEVDLILKRGSELFPVEIKSSQTFNNDFMKGINYFTKLVPDRVKNPQIVYDGNFETELHGIKILNFRNFQAG